MTYGGAAVFHVRDITPAEILTRISKFVQLAIRMPFHERSIVQKIVTSSNDNLVGMWL